MIYLKQSTAATIKLGPFVDSGDGVTAETGLTLQKADVRLSKNGGNMAAAAADQGESDAGAAHDELGYYDISLGTGDTDTLGRLKVMVSESGALPVWAEYEVLPANVFDSIVAGTDKLDANAAELGGTPQTGRDIGASVLLSSGTGTGQISLSSGAVTAGTVNDKTGYGLADDAITSAKFDESTAFPLKSADTGPTAVARTGADSDTLETLSDQMDTVTTNTTGIPGGEDIADAVWEAALANYLLGNGTFGAFLGDLLDQIESITKSTSSESITDLFPYIVWAPKADGSENAEPGWPSLSFGALFDAYVDESIASRASQTSVDTVDGIVDTIVARIIGTLAAGTHNPQSGDAYGVVNNGTYGNSALKTLVDDLPTNSELSTALAGADDAVLAAIAALNNLSSAGAQAAAEAALAAYGAALESTLTAIKGATWSDETLEAIKAAVDGVEGGGDDAETIAAAVWDEAKVDHTTEGTYGAYLDMAISSIGTGTGDIAFTYTMTEDDEVTPISGVTVKVSTDSDGASMIRQGITDADGEVVFNMDAGTRYFWRYKDGYYFDNPDIEVVSEDA